MVGKNQWKTQVLMTYDMEYDGVLMKMSEEFIYNKSNGWNRHGW